MTLIDRHKPLLRDALRKIQEIEDVRRLFAGTTDKPAQDIHDNLRREYLEILAELQHSTELFVGEQETLGLKGKI